MADGTDDVPQWPAVCHDRGHDLTGVPPSEPCPECGDTNRKYLVTPEPDTVTAVEKAGLEIEYLLERSWREQWGRLLDDLAAMERLADGIGERPLDPREVVDAFCAECYILKEWLRRDPAVPQKAQNGVNKFAAESTAIHLACNIHNTHKHYGRDPGYTTAAVSPVSIPDGVRVSWTITWDKPDGTSGTTDALEMARGAIADWRSYFAAYGLSESE
ncbi:hypothetical protein HUT16_19405 [Kitasatospora sp. NA04385]|uniref:hypothetical protein n=1 Tax=Kitasatospora sp. NA04385 TaxID=2742135 RepID=UPI0015902496|nr:hypothetical protein [Kitasatospora sp. NA04385]QKW20934.1 hypothetical protein HUT16_19405 [Kitasatospora sp. NA04385]